MKKSFILLILGLFVLSLVLALPAYSQKKDTYVIPLEKIFKAPKNKTQLGERILVKYPAQTPCLKPGYTTFIFGKQYIYDFKGYYRRLDFKMDSTKDNSFVLSHLSVRYWNGKKWVADFTSPEETRKGPPKAFLEKAGMVSHDPRSKQKITALISKKPFRWIKVGCSTCDAVGTKNLLNHSSMLVHTITASMPGATPAKQAPPPGIKQTTQERRHHK